MALIEHDNLLKRVKTSVETSVADLRRVPTGFKQIFFTTLSLTVAVSCLLPFAYLFYIYDQFRRATSYPTTGASAR